MSEWRCTICGCVNDGAYYSCPHCWATDEGEAPLCAAARGVVGATTGGTNE